MKIRNRKIPTWQGFLAIFFVAVFLGLGLIWTTDSVSSQIEGNPNGIVSSVKKAEKDLVTAIVQVFDDPEPLPPPPPPPSWDSIKNKGCVADGVLNGHGGNNKRVIKVINRSECEYLHRSIETWLEAPDFDDIKKNKKKITKDDMVFGMFIAEAIDTKADYYYPAEERDFDFSKMCKEGTKNAWGEHTCRPSFNDAILVEIKTPVTKIVSTRYRKGVHKPSNDLSGSVIQVLDYRRELSQNIQTITHGTPHEIDVFNPRCVVIIGNASEELDTDKKRKSFELFRSNLKDVEIVTFDELFKKAETLATLFNLRWNDNKHAKSNSVDEKPRN